METLEVRGLTVEFDHDGYWSRPLDRFAASACSGELVLLLGPSGSGKSTLLACLAGIRTPARGQIRVDGTDITALNPRAMSEYRRRGVGIVFQAFKLVPSLTARENVEVPMRLVGTPGRAARDRAEELLRRFGLGEEMNRRPGRLSGGQQQRVAIARALAHDPPLLLADEPTAQLDYVQVEIVLRTLRELAAPGRIVIVSTHDRRLVPVADRVIDLTAPRTLQLPRVRQYSLGAGEVLYRQGGSGRLIFLVERGEIELLREGSAGTEQVVDVVGPGGYFGELAVLLELPRTSCARARTDSLVTGLSVAEFRALLGPDGMRRVITGASAGDVTDQRTAEGG